MIPLLVVSLILIGVGFLVTEKNAPNILAGYNTLSEEKQKEIDYKGLVFYFRKFHVFLGTSLFLIGSALNFLINQKTAGVFMISYMFLGYIWLLYKTTHFSPKLNKTGNYIAMAIMAAILLFILNDIRNEGKPTELQLSANQIEYVGGYTHSIAFPDIQSVGLVDSFPEIKKKKSGANLGKLSKGRFITKEGEEVLLILAPKKSPYLYIQTKDGKKIYSSTDS